jgi:V8-like Glu-specific endopeptidase
MDLRQVFSDSAVKAEFLERFDELAAQAPAETGGFESLEGGVSLPDPAAAVESMAEGTFSPGSEPGLEAIIERFTRPVHLVQQSTFKVPPDTFPNSEEIRAKLDGGRAGLEHVIPSSGRIDLRNGRLDWVGTGWMVAPDVVVTNRHVAEEFSMRQNGGFAFKANFGAPPVSASIDWRHEHERTEESIFRVQEIIWVEPPGSVDVALVRISSQGFAGDSEPAVVDLMTRAEIVGAGVGAWVAVVGYPARDSRNDLADQQRIFDGIYNVKRLAPGQVTAIVAQDLLHHDATTLGGNSGSVIVDLDSGKAMGLHFGGIEGDRNSAVQAHRVQEIVAQRVSRARTG